MGDPSNYSIPQHIAFIPDGNRRWAKARAMPVLAGYKEGYNALKRVISSLLKYKVKYATFFAFSIENENRPKQEVDYLMALFFSIFNDATDFFMEHGIRVRIIGNSERWRPSLKKSIEKIQEETKNNDVLTIIGAVSYSGHDEIVRATKKIISDVKNGKLDENCIDESVFSSYLDCPDVPFPDLLVRTSEQRISNYLLWQLAYSEIIWVDKFWPDFGDEDTNRVIQDFSKRQRRYGK